MSTSHVVVRATVVTAVGPKLSTTWSTPEATAVYECFQVRPFSVCSVNLPHASYFHSSVRPVSTSLRDVRRPTPSYPCETLTLLRAPTVVDAPTGASMRTVFG